MGRPAFLITIDTEGDNLWARPSTITTHNAKYLPRFQELCERYSLPPTWLTNYEMALCNEFLGFARDVLARGRGEIGMHLHAWNSPPIVPLTRDDYRHQPYLIDYPTAVLEAKIDVLTDLLETTFGQKMTSHRAGRWALDARYVGALARRGYEVDCSVTPHVSWRHARGAPDGIGGSDYTGAPQWPYRLALTGDVSRPGDGPVLEVPMTTRRAFPRLSRWLPPVTEHVGMLRSVRRARLWLRPKRGNREEMVRLLDRARAEDWPYVEFMLHSSEFMPGGSPTFRTDAEVERLFDDLASVFERARDAFEGLTLTAFARRWTARMQGDGRDVTAAGRSAPAERDRPRRG